MAEITNLDELVPEDMEFVFEGKTYYVPGDIDVETTFRLQKLILELSQAEVAAMKAAGQGGGRVEKARAAQERVTLATQQEILRLFKIKQPDLEKLPAGARGFQAILARILAHLGFSNEVEEPPDPTPTKKKPRPKPSGPSTSSPS